MYLECVITAHRVSLPYMLARYSPVFPSRIISITRGLVEPLRLLICDEIQIDPGFDYFVT